MYVPNEGQWMRHKQNHFLAMLCLAHHIHDLFPFPSPKNAYPRRKWGKNLRLIHPLPVALRIYQLVYIFPPEYLC